jgi:hypothetical protein
MRLQSGGHLLRSFGAIENWGDRFNLGERVSCLWAPKRELCRRAVVPLRQLLGRQLQRAHPESG